MGGPSQDPSTDVTEVGGGDAACPYCGSDDTVKEHPKGPSLCRSLYFCNDCQEPFERFG